MQWSYEPCLGRSTWLPGLFLRGTQEISVDYLYPYKEISDSVSWRPERGSSNICAPRVPAAPLTTAESEQMGSIQKGKYYSPLKREDFVKLRATGINSVGIVSRNSPDMGRHLCPAQWELWVSGSTETKAGQRLWGWGEWLGMDSLFDGDRECHEEGEWEAF